MTRAAKPLPCPRDYVVTVCAACLCASCWHGESMCDASRSADTVTRLASELDALGYEHADNYSRAKLIDVCGEVVTGAADMVTAEDRRAAWHFAIGRPGQYGMNRVQSTDPIAWFKSGEPDMVMRGNMDGYDELVRTAKAFARHRANTSAPAKRRPASKRRTGGAK